MYFKVDEFLISKETVELRRWERSKQKFGFINSFNKTKFLYFKMAPYSFNSR